MSVTRPKLTPDSDASKRLEKAAAAHSRAQDELRASVYAAADAGGSVREIARLGQLSTNTVQAWLKAR